MNCSKMERSGFDLDGSFSHPVLSPNLRERIEENQGSLTENISSAGLHSEPEPLTDVHHTQLEVHLVMHVK
jgi:hypothetical protein